MRCLLDVFVRALWTVSKVTVIFGSTFKLYNEFSVSTLGRPWLLQYAKRASPRLRSFSSPSATVASEPWRSINFVTCQDSQNTYKQWYGTRWIS